MSPSARQPEPCVEACKCRTGLDRRNFLKITGLSSAAALLSPLGAMAGPFTREDFHSLVPEDKKLSPEWLASLYARGERAMYRGAELEKIGMPVGGIAAGQLYLGGDGKLWHWDIFNRHQDTGSGGPHYAHPLKPESPLAHGFALRWTQGERTGERRFERTAWADVSFTGEYPIGFVEYADPAVPVRVSLEAYSPFVPLVEADSCLPATIMQFTVTNVSGDAVDVDIGGWLENAVCLDSASNSGGTRSNRVLRFPSCMLLECVAEAPKYPQRESNRPDVLFEDFESERYEKWTATGTAFGTGPVAQAAVPEYQGQLGMDGQRTVNSHAAAPGQTAEQRDSATGTLRSAPFTIERDFISFLVGGGNHKGRTCLNLMIGERVAMSVTGQADNRMRQRVLDVRPLQGQQAQLEIVDRESGPWGNIGVDRIVFTDTPPPDLRRFEDLPDFGAMGLLLLHDEEAPQKAENNFGAAELSAEDWAKSVLSLSRVSEEGRSRPVQETLVGGLGRRLRVKPGEKETVVFAVAWYFPNLRLPGLPDHGGRQYGKMFSGLHQVAEYVSDNFTVLRDRTHLWHRTWYDSTLPYWFLDRTFLNTSILATSTCYWLGSGRFYGWEGVGCCAGTCGHVWQYAQAMARLFPAFERSLREMVDYGVAFDEPTGRIRFRAEHNDIWAVDSQAGVVLRTYREHQMNNIYSTFLQRLWPRTKRALQFLIECDEARNGIIDGPQHNTLDTDWYGAVAWLSGLYLAALRAGAEMAKEMGDTQFEEECRTILAQGQTEMLRLFNGEYFINKVDPAHLDAINSGTGCHIDQVMGQGWAFQVGLDRVLPEKETRAALQSLWRYNFTPDVGPYRQAYKAGRWYAMPGEAGLLMCTFPAADWDYAQAKGKGPDWAAGYFNECMNGFEYQVAGHMIWEGMLQEGLAITRAVHDRYHASRRNPWNEIECGDHYARSMASYGVYLAICGYEYHAPKRYLAFAPRLQPENFRAAFTTASGWGTYSQVSAENRATVELRIRFGSLRLHTLALGALPALSGQRPVVELAGKPVSATLSRKGGTREITFETELELMPSQGLRIQL